MRLPNYTASLLPLYSSSAAASLLLFCAAILIFAPASSSAQDRYAQMFEHARGHDTPQWSAISAHLPDRLRASPASLEAQGDTLRARRYTDDANDFYNYALQNGGDPARLLNKIGITELESRDLLWARFFFGRVVSIDRNAAEGWNNLGVVEHISGRLLFAISNYERATRLDPSSAVYHANLAIAYLDHAELSAARREIQSALRLDPAIFESEGETEGAAARVVSSTGRLRLLLELARLYARGNDEPRMMHSLAAAAEAGIDIRAAMRHDRVLSAYVNDPRVLVLSRNSTLLRSFGETGQDQPAPRPYRGAATPALPPPSDVGYLSGKY